MPLGVSAFLELSCVWTALYQISWSPYAHDFLLKVVFAYIDIYFYMLVLSYVPVFGKYNKRGKFGIISPSGNATHPTAVHPALYSG